MSFTDPVYVPFFLIMVLFYWGTRHDGVRKAALLAGNYVFYGWVHPWFVFLIATTTLVDYLCARGMGARRDRAVWFLVASLTFNLGLLFTFKYFGFFWDTLAWAGGVPSSPPFSFFLPVGISFYTFQSIGYVVDVYRCDIDPEPSLLNYALFVSFFPQLVAGPIERASRLLGPLKTRPAWRAEHLHNAFPLLLSGLLKKMVVADNLAVFVDQIFSLGSPSPDLLLVGALGFTFQILADFSGYTDIARGSACLFGIDLRENFREPYRARHPADFWRRWHITLSEWIRDYLYKPLGGSSAADASIGLMRRPFRWFATRIRNGAVLLATMGLCGLWHGAQWKYVAWGLYHGLLIAVYRVIRARPWGYRWTRTTLAIPVMFGWTVIGWTIFRAPDWEWFVDAALPPYPSASSGSMFTALVLGALMAGFASLLWYAGALRAVRRPWAGAVLGGVAIALVYYLSRPFAGSFIYFQF